MSPEAAICGAADPTLLSRRQHDSSTFRSGRSDFVGLGPRADIAIDWAARGPIDAISHVWTAPCWQGLFWCCHEELVGSAHVSGLFARREHRWPSCYPQDRLPIKSTRSRRSGMNGFCRSPVVDRLLHDLTCRPFQLHEARPDGPADCYAACVTGSRYSPPRVISTQAIRAILLAMATAAILLFRRCNSLSNQGRRVPWR